jgi:hypothetical protein
VSEDSRAVYRIIALNKIYGATAFTELEAAPRACLTINKYFDLLRLEVASATEKAAVAKAASVTEAVCYSATPTQLRRRPLRGRKTRSAVSVTEAASESAKSINQAPANTVTKTKQLHWCIAISISDNFYLIMHLRDDNNNSKNYISQPNRNNIGKQPLSIGRQPRHQHTSTSSRFP